MTVNTTSEQKHLEISFRFGKMQNFAIALRYGEDFRKISLRLCRLQNKGEEGAEAHLHECIVSTVCIYEPVK
jgi:hypothetical protein